VNLFHITTRADWTAAVAAGAYRPASLESEGFVHLSGEAQWQTTANRFFRGRAGLVLLRVRADRLRARLAYEAADGDVFPHLYGELNLDAVVEVFDLPLGDDGAIGAPEGLASDGPASSGGRC
jgi:uncharacterized protein (DUF952 family)